MKNIKAHSNLRVANYPLGMNKGPNLTKKTFCGLSMGKNQYWAGRVYDMCVYYMTGTPEGSTESGFMEKPGIEPATPGLQGIALIHYTTGASCSTQSALYSPLHYALIYGHI